MILKTKGRPHGIYSPIVARVSDFFAAEDIYLRDNERNTLLLKSEDGDTIISKRVGNLNDRGIFQIQELNHLQTGDIVVVNTDGVVNTLYRVDSHHNFMLFTERCNSNCLMCSQPPKDKDDTHYFYSLYSKMIPLIPKDCFELGITGGEPTLLGSRFLDLLQQLKTQLPDTEIHCLTNGRTFAWHAAADSLGGLQYDRLMLGIPLYSDVYHLHDYIVQAKGAYQQTIDGLYNLASNNQRIEIRIVLHQQTIPRLAKLAKFIYKNLPFVEHIAFMGLEHQGYTPFNIDRLWIDPIDYQKELAESVLYLAAMDMNVSIYNAQLCTLPESLWPYARRSISDWKNVYLEECNNCSVLEQCGGLFESGLRKHSGYIRALQ